MDFMLLSEPCFYWCAGGVQSTLSLQAHITWALRLPPGIGILSMLCGYFFLSPFIGGDIQNNN
jgi:hypothetical protein